MDIIGQWKVLGPGSVFARNYIMCFLRNIIISGVGILVQCCKTEAVFVGVNLVMTWTRR